VIVSRRLQASERGGATPAINEDRHGPAVWNMEAMLLVLESSQRKDNLAISLP
jgi:hypothetical protein